MQNFIMGQGYDQGPAAIYQYNLSCMSLVKRDGPGSKRSRHINIRHFWVVERMTAEEVIVEHLGMDRMYANALTKPVRGV